MKARGGGERGRFKGDTHGDGAGGRAERGAGKHGDLLLDEAPGGRDGGGGGRGRAEVSAALGVGARSPRPQLLPPLPVSPSPLPCSLPGHVPLRVPNAACSPSLSSSAPPPRPSCVPLTLSLSPPSLSLQLVVAAPHGLHTHGHPHSPTSFLVPLAPRAPYPSCPSPPPPRAHPPRRPARRAPRPRSASTSPSPPRSSPQRCAPSPSSLGRRTPTWRSPADLPPRALARALALDSTAASTRCASSFSLSCTLRRAQTDPNGRARRSPSSPVTASARRSLSRSRRSSRCAPAPRRTLSA